MMDHPSAEDVYEKVSLEYPRISKATVYRNLSLLAQQGVIRKVEMPGVEADRYDFNLKPHYHAVCLKCGKIVDAFIHDEVKLEVNYSEDFTPVSTDMVIYGLCKNCKN